MLPATKVIPMESSLSTFTSTRLLTRMFESS
jgi:hypothetical protein